MILGPIEYRILRKEKNEPVSYKYLDEESVDLRNGAKHRFEKIDESEVEKRGDHFVWKQDPSLRLFARAYLSDRINRR